MWRRHVCYVCKRSVCGGDEPQPVAHMSHKLQCARQSLKIMVSYGNKYPRHNARPHVVEESGQCARALIECLSFRPLSSHSLLLLYWAGPDPLRVNFPWNRSSSKQQQENEGITFVTTGSQKHDRLVSDFFFFEVAKNGFTTLDRFGACWWPNCLTCHENHCIPFKGTLVMILDAPWRKFMPSCLAREYATVAISRNSTTPFPSNSIMGGGGTLDPGIPQLLSTSL